VHKLQIYIMHYTPNVARRKLLTKILNKELSGIVADINWITDYDKEMVTYSDFVNNFSADHITHQQRQPTEYYPRYPLQPEVVSLCLKHKLAIEQYLNDTYALSKDFCLFLEDDAILHEDFVTKLNRYLKSLPEDFDAAFIGQGCNKRIPAEELKDSVYWYRKEYPADRNTDSILFSRKFLTSLLQNLNTHKMAFPIDHEYSFWFRVMNANVYWLEPPLVTQGSQIGLFDSFQPPHSRFLDTTIKSRDDLESLL